jgi:hypothetical protein
MSCRFGLHGQSARRHSVRNGAIEFAECPHCATPFVRHEGGRWRTVPTGFRVVWRAALGE